MPRRDSVDKTFRTGWASEGQFPDTPPALTQSDSAGSLFPPQLRIAYRKSPLASAFLVLSFPHWQDPGQAGRWHDATPP